jgi:hypothetical protein
MLAVRVGFEPTEPAKVQRFSRPPDSTALAPHRIFKLTDFSSACNCRQLDIRELMGLIGVVLLRSKARASRRPTLNIAWR